MGWRFAPQHIKRSGSARAGLRSLRDAFLTDAIANGFHVAQRLMSALSRKRHIQSTKRRKNFLECQSSFLEEEVIINY